MSHANTDVDSELDSQLEWATACTRRHIYVRPARFIRNHLEQWKSATKVGNLSAGTLGVPSHEIRDPRQTS